MNVGTGDEDCQYYFANAHKLNTIYIYSENHQDDKVEITDDTDNTAKNKNCWIELENLCLPIVGP